MLAIRARARRGSCRLRRGTVDQQQPHHLPARQSVRQPERHLDRLFLLRAARRRLQGDGRRQAFAAKLWDTVAISDFYSNPACIVRMGLAEAHQQRSRPDRPHADDRRAQAQPSQHHRRSAQARGGRQGRHLAAAAARHRCRHGARLDERHHRGRALRQGIRRSTGATASRSCKAAGEGVSASTRSPTSPGAMPRISRRPRGSMRRTKPGHASPGATAPTSSASTPSRRRARCSSSWASPATSMCRAAMLLAGAAAQLSRAVGPPAAGAGGEAARRRPLQGDQSHALCLCASAERSSSTILTEKPYPVKALYRRRQQHRDVLSRTRKRIIEAMRSSTCWSCRTSS